MIVKGPDVEITEEDLRKFVHGPLLVSVNVFHNTLVVILRTRDEFDLLNAKIRARHPLTAAEKRRWAELFSVLVTHELYCRALEDFFLGRGTRTDDANATDVVPRPEEWNSALDSIDKPLAALRDLVNKDLIHLTYSSRMMGRNYAEFPADDSLFTLRALEAFFRSMKGGPIDEKKRLEHLADIAGTREKFELLVAEANRQALEEGRRWQP